MKKIYSVSLATVKYILFSLLVISYFLQVPFRLLAKFISVFALFFALANYRSWLKLFKRPLFCLYCLYISICIFCVAFNLNAAIGKIIRFSEIFLMIPLFFCIDESKNSNFYSKVFVRIAFLKAIVLFSIYGIIVKTGSYSAIRAYGHLKGWGDIYSFGSMFLTRVQVQGNALLVMAFFTACYKKDKLFYRVALFLACLIAGNKAYLIGIFLFVLYFFASWLFKTKRSYNFDFKVCFLLLCAMLTFPVIINKANSILEEKTGYSNAVRKDQAEILLSGNIITGNGVGNTITAKTKYRDYSGADYFEVQTLYVINQIGIIGYSLFLILTFGLLLKRKNSFALVFIYFSYLAYTFFNPYCFDTTHMITGFLLCSVFYSHSKKEACIK